LAGWTHNPSVVGSSPTRPQPHSLSVPDNAPVTCGNLWVFRDLGSRDGVRLCAACQYFVLSVLAWGFVDAALGGPVLARDPQWRERAPWAARRSQG
jgi:hypothetical protein